MRGSHGCPGRRSGSRHAFVGSDPPTALVGGAPQARRAIAELTGRRYEPVLLISDHAMLVDVTTHAGLRAEVEGVYWLNAGHVARRLPDT